MSAPLTVGGWYGRVGVEILRGSECVAVVGRLQSNRLGHLDTIRSTAAKRGEAAHYAEAEAQGLEAGQADVLALARTFAASEELLERLKIRVEQCGCCGDADFAVNLACLECQADVVVIARAESR